MDYPEMVARARELGGVPDEARAERALQAALETLGERLLPDVARRLAGELPEVAGGRLLLRRVPGSFSLAELYGRVSRRTGETHGFAIEQTQAAFAVLAEAAPEACVQARATLPADIGELLARRVRASTRPQRPSRMGPDHPYRHTLATGRPGSSHPLSEAAPDRAHADSVAKSDQPHADTKLSSSPGTTQERLRESLATGRPGSSRPISG
jgi:uncharacterized protein (DUF2267 family)